MTTLQRTGGCAVACAAMLLAATGAAEGGGVPRTGVAFRTADAGLQALFDAAEAKCASNVVQFTPSMRILVEGGGYNNAWLETQPMGGEMYAKRDVEVALNNQVIFLDGQRADGRLPGMVVSTAAALKRGCDTNPPEGYVWLPAHGIAADFEMFQGYCFPDPAWRMYVWAGRDSDYLRRLYQALEAHDAYLWRTRDSNGDGILETWCVWDTGEDNSTRLVTRNAPTRWPFEVPPGDPRTPDPQDPANMKRYWGEHAKAKLPAPRREDVLVPFASMDVMAYSYEGRATLARIARELDNGREEHWLREAADVRRRLVERLWDPARHACFDRDRTGRRLEELVHNNIRCMWYGVFTQEMADAFIHHHLVNPAEFWTPVPLPSIAVHDPLYRNDEGNSWSGQPQGLTYQRAIRALENYGHIAEVTLLGRKLLPVLIRNGCKFAQQLDARTGRPSGPKDDGYGPMMLAALEYISRMHGIHVDVAAGRVWWSAVDGTDFTYTQRWGDREWTLACGDGRCSACLNGREMFTFTAGVRVVTDLDGEPIEVAGLEAEKRTVRVAVAGGADHAVAIGPNEGMRWNGAAAPSPLRAVPFR